MKTAVVIPSYKVKGQILNVIRSIDTEVDKIYVVDDSCPEHTGDFVKENITDSRIEIIHHTKNQGVGGAVKSGYRAAIRDGMDIVIKIDGDGQMNPQLAPKFITPIIQGEADYTKGNRFFNLEDAEDMPRIRYFGNLTLSFLTKLSTGYWKNFDPTNGYTAISTRVLELINLDHISDDYFFESDMLYRLGLCRAKVVDIPMEAKYEDEESNLKIKKILIPFLKKNIKNTYKRVLYNYFIRDFSIASLELLAGILLLVFGVVFGGIHWIDSYVTQVPATSGTVMIAGLSIIVSLQLKLSFLSYDIGNIPTETLHTKLGET